MENGLAQPPPVERPSVAAEEAEEIQEAVTGEGDMIAGLVENAIARFAAWRDARDWPDLTQVSTILSDPHARTQALQT